MMTWLVHALGATTLEDAFVWGLLIGWSTEAAYWMLVRDGR